MTLAEVARRFEAAGVAHVHDALRSLQRCKPARPPVYRDGDHYALDPLDDELDLWAFRLGLRPPKVQRPQPPSTAAAPEWHLMLVDELGVYVDDRDVQLARLEAMIH